MTPQLKINLRAFGCRNFSLPSRPAGRLTSPLSSIPTKPCWPPGFISTIHFFNTHLRPEKSPMDMVIFNDILRGYEMKEDWLGASLAN